MLRIFERVTAVLLLIYLSGAFIPLIIDEGYPADVNTLSDYRLLLILVLLYIPLLGILCVRIWSNRPILIPPFWLALLIMWTICSVCWAGDPTHAIKRLVWDLLAMIFGLYLGSTYTNLEEVDLLFGSLAFCSVCSLIIALVYPSGAYMHGGELEGNLRGVFEHKNVLGKNMLLLGSACVYRLRAGPQIRRGRIYFVLALAVLLLIMSKSMTSLIAIMLALVVLPLVRLLRLPPYKIVLGGALLLLAMVASIAVVAPSIGYILAMFGKRSDLTGRSELWSLVINAIGRHPWQGYGVYTFWNGMYGPSASVIEAVGWDVPHAHNGFLDLLLDVGIVGLLLFALTFVGALRGSVRKYRRGSGETAVWPLLFLAIFILGNLTESSILHASLFWTLFVSTAYRASREVVSLDSASVAGKRNLCIPRPAIAPIRSAVHEG